jgi:hypothetical protein
MTAIELIYSSTQFLKEPAYGAAYKRRSLDPILRLWVASRVLKTKFFKFLRFLKNGVEGRVTRCFCEKVAQNVAQSIFEIINT